MFFLLFGLVLLALFLFGLAVNALLLKLSCKVAMVPDATFWKSVRIALVTSLLTLGLYGLALYWLPLGKMDLVQIGMIEVALLFVTALAFPLALIRRQWRISMGKGLLVCILWNVFMAIAAVAIMVPLVLVGKQFVEPFVIPTGSMADTLLGYHKDVTCPECGYRFAVNASMEAEPQANPFGHQVPFRVSGCVCPNCRQEIKLTEPREVAGDKPSVRDPGLASGERVLVNKIMAGPFGGKVERFDLVVFRLPEQRMVLEGLITYGPPQQIYVKRLVGQGPEIIGIHNGDLYSFPGERAHRDHFTVHFARLQGQDVVPHQELLEKGDPCFQILRKPPDLTLALKQLVYDNDHPSAKQAKHSPRWVSEEDGNSWTPVEPHGFRGTSREGDRLRWLRYRHLAHSSDSNTAGLITDFNSFNSFQPQPGRGADRTGQNWVGDLILECEVTVDDPKGELVLELSKGIDRFRARWDLASGKCSLWRTKEAQRKSDPPAPDAFEELAHGMTSLKGKGTFRLRFANVDHRLTVWINDGLTFGEGVAYERHKDPGPYPNDLQPASIGVSGSMVSIQHLKLWRDVYYSCEPGAGDADGVMGEGVKLWSDPERWGPLRELHGVTFYVEPGHYFFLGDNSSHAFDSRVWGTVPESHLLGKPMMIYYPFSRMGRVR